MNMANQPSPLDRLHRRLDGFGRWRRRWRGLAGLGRFLWQGLGGLLLWFLVDWCFELPAWPLLISFVAALASFAWSLPWHAVRPWLRRLRRPEEARQIETLHGQLDNLVIGALQLGEELAAAEHRQQPVPHSPLLVRALLKSAADRLDALPLPALLDRRAAKQALAVGLGVLVATLLCLAVATDAVRRRGDRLADAYATVLDSLFQIDIEVRPGNRAVVRHTPLRLEVTVRGGRRSAVTLWRQLAEDSPPEAEELTLIEQSASFEIAAVEAGFDYSFTYGKRRSESFSIVAGDLPEIAAISYELAYPAYTGQSPRTITGRLPVVHGLAGTNVLVSFAATTELHPEGCRVEWQQGAAQPITVNGRFGHFSFRLEHPDRATLHLTGSLGREFVMQRPLSFEVQVLPDRPPAIRLLTRQPSLSLLAEQAAFFGVEFEAEDDFGVAEVSLDYRVEAIDELLGRPLREGQIQRRLEPPQDRLRGHFSEMFQALTPPLAPGDRIVLSVVARDNNSETGPGLGRSQPLEIVVVAADLAAFAERRFGFGEHALLGGLSRVKRQTDLLIEPGRAVRTQEAREIARHELRARVNQESWPSGSEDAVGQYFQVLSGGK